MTLETHRAIHNSGNAKICNEPPKNLLVQPVLKSLRKKNSSISVSKYVRGTDGKSPTAQRNRKIKIRREALNLNISNVMNKNIMYTKFATD